jgi:ligand-binding sensor domain-containing protein
MTLKLITKTRLLIKIALIFILLHTTMACKQTSSPVNENKSDGRSHKSGIGIEMHSDSIMPPELVKARPGKTYAVRSAEIRQLPVDYGIFNGFSTMPNLTTNDGLALDVISNGDKISLCDRNGNLWFGTGSGGVSRYDGKCFKNFTTEQGLANNIVWSIIEDKQGNIWFGTDDGVSCYNGKVFINYNISEGLIHQAVRSITEDSYGNLWFCTEGGISRFDGKNFISYTAKDGLPPFNFISSFTDTKGNLWFGTQGGGVIEYKCRQTNYLCQKNRCKHNLKVARDIELHRHEIAQDFIKISTLHGLINNTIQCIYEDKKGNILFGTYGSGVYQFDADQMREPCYLNTCKHNLLIKKEHEDHTQIISKSIRRKYDLIGPSKIINHIAGDSKGNIWFATDLGVCCYDQKRFTYFTTNEGLSNNNVSCIVEDQRNNIWFGTFGGGINLFDGKGIVNYPKNQGVITNLVTSILENESASMYFAEYKRGLTIYDGQKLSSIHLKELSENKSITSLFSSKKGVLGFGTVGNGVCFYDGNKVTNFNTTHGLIYDYVEYCLRDKHDNLWIATQKGVSCFDGKNFRNYTTKQGLVDNNVFCLFEDSKGNVWFGTHGGLSCYNGKFFTNYTTQQGIKNNYIYCITEDRFKNLWFATDAGACRYDGKSFKNFTTTDGLPNNITTQILISKEQNIVLGTNKGICLLTAFRSKNSFESMNESDMQQDETSIPAINHLSNGELDSYSPNIEIYNSSTGYPINDVNFGCHAMYEDSKGIIWVGTGSDKTGLVRFDYSSINKNTKPLNLKIQNIKVNQQNIGWYNLLNHQSDKKHQDELEFLLLNKSLSSEERKKEIRQFGDIKFDSISRFYNLPQKLILPYHLNTITFEYAAIEPARPKIVKYQTLLEGYDEGWKDVGNKNDVTYGNLTEGTYTFKVRAANQFNVLNKPMSYTFTVLPPYYRTWWAYCLYIIVFVGIVLSYNYLNHRKSIKLAQLIIQKQDEEKQRISRDLHDDLGQELSYLKLNTAIENKHTIDRIIQKLRAISYNLSPVKIIDSTIKDLLRELIIEAEKSNLFFSYELDDIDIKNNEIKINLFRITQEGLTNIIKHSKAENVRITLKKIDDYLVLELQDNGIGISSQKNSNTIGLSSMKERAKIINASITIETTEKGTKIKLKLKLPSNEV